MSERSLSDIMKAVHEELKAPITNEPPSAPTPVIVVEGKTWTQIAQLCFSTMPYGEYMDIVEAISADKDKLWGWADACKNNN